MNRRNFITNSALTAAGISGAMKAAGAILPQNLNQSNNLSGLKLKHPFLHFDSKRLDILRKNKEEGHLRYVNFLYQWIEENKSWIPPFITGKDGDEVQLEECAAYLTNASLAYCLSKKKQHFDLALQWALKMCEIPKGAVTNYAMGIYMAGLGRAYDWLYNDLKPQDRETIKNTIADFTKRMYEGTLPGAKVAMWWTDSPIHHDHWIAVGGLGEASLSIIVEVPETAKYATYVKDNLDHGISLLGDDGAWYEGVADWCYTMAPLLWFYGAWESATKERLYDKSWIKNTATYRLYHRLTDRDYVYLNDSFRCGRYSTSGGASCHLLRRLASLFKDGHTQWLADQDERFDLLPSPKGVNQAPYENLSFGGNPKEYPYPKSQIASWNILWFDPSVKAVAPEDLPKAHYFNNQEIVIMRSGWSEQDAVVSLACGPLAGQKAAEQVRKGERLSNIGHAHCNPSTFTLFAKGQYFIIPSGYARRSSNFQNVISFNGADFISDAALPVKIAGFRNTEGFSYAVAEATAAFQPNLGVESYRRHMLLFGNKLYIFDDIKVGKAGMRTSGVNRFSWTAHSEPATHKFSIQGNKVTWQSLEGQKTPLSMFLLDPQQYAWERELFQSAAGKPMMEALRITKPEWYTGKMQLLTAWMWESETEAPKVIKEKDYIAVLTGKDRAVGFSLNQAVPSNFGNAELAGRELLLFGTDSANPDSLIRSRDGKITIESAAKPFLLVK